MTRGWRNESERVDIGGRKVYNQDKRIKLVWPSDKAIEWYVRNEFKSENEILECEL